MSQNNKNNKFERKLQKKIHILGLLHFLAITKLIFFSNVKSLKYFQCLNVILFGSNLHLYKLVFSDSFLVFDSIL